MTHEINIQTPSNQPTEGVLPQSPDEEIQQRKMDNFMEGRFDAQPQSYDPNYHDATKYEHRTEAVLDTPGRAPAAHAALARIATNVSQNNERLLSPKFAAQEYKTREQARVRVGL